MKRNRWSIRRTLLALAWAAGVIAGCGPAVPSPTPAPSLKVEILYPTLESQPQAGDPIRATARVTDSSGAAVDAAAVSFTLRDGSGALQAVLDGEPGGQGLFRGPAWTIPVRAAGGAWSVEAEAIRGQERGAAGQAFRVNPSTTRLLHDKYGFWLDAPSLRGIIPTLAAERGDASNGMIRWGGGLPAAHILPSAWIDVQWRRGDFGLISPEAVRRFLLEQVGDLGASRVRSLGEPQPENFKGWDGWLVPARGQLRYEQVEWLVFYVPEVECTWALGTTLVAPPEGIDAHAALRRSFQVDAAWVAAGVAPEPLPVLLPGPVLLEPEIGTVFYGPEAAIVLRWEPLRELVTDEYYEVTIDYAYSESAPLVRSSTRETWVRLPPDLYREPNCAVFNWSVRLMRTSGPGRGASQAIAISHPSLTSYVVWKRPPAEPAPFPPLCPNEQI